MKKIRFSKKERRVIIVLMLINCFALFVNVFKMDFNNKEDSSRTWYSNVNLKDKKDRGIKMWDYTHTTIYYLTDPVDNPEVAFWPFVKFKYSRTNNDRGYDKFFREYRNSREYTVFRGVFPDFDYTEFLVYSLLIFGIPILRKLW